MSCHFTEPHSYEGAIILPSPDALNTMLSVEFGERFFDAM
jgi:hypothetical protein